MINLLANENFPKASVVALRKLGYNVLWIGEDHASIKDHEVIGLAISQGRLILTFDRDYGELVFKKGFKPPQGIIYLRIASYSPEQPAEIVDKLIKSKRFEFNRNLTVVDSNFIRQRKY